LRQLEASIQASLYKKRDAIEHKASLHLVFCLVMIGFSLANEHQAETKLLQSARSVYLITKRASLSLKNIL
jgi:hypothetical protein